MAPARPQAFDRRGTRACRCGYRPGDVNPYGLKRVSLKNGAQIPPSGTLSFVPLLMEYDVLSQSLLFITKGYPTVCI